MTTTPTTVTWYYDGEPTHGVAGLACASTESEVNTVGVGPDYEFAGTAQQMADHLLAEGYDDLDTDSAELRQAWEARTPRTADEREAARRAAVDEQTVITDTADATAYMTDVLGRRKMARALDAVENADAEEHTAWGRAETDPCERGTVGCSVLHTDYPDDTDCEVW